MSAIQKIEQARWEETTKRIEMETHFEKIRKKYYYGAPGITKPDPYTRGGLQHVMDGASYNGDLASLKWLFEVFAPYVQAGTHNYNTMLLAASGEGHLSIVKYILEREKLDVKKFEPNPFSVEKRFVNLSEALDAAKSRGHVKVEKYLSTRI